MKHIYKVLFLFLTITIITSAQSKSISGKIINSQTKASLVNANISIDETKEGTVSDADGEFTIVIKNLGNATIVVSHIGFKQKEIKVNTLTDEVINLTVELVPSIVTMGETVVTSNKYNSQLKDIALPVEVMSTEEISNNAPVTVSDALVNIPGVSLSRDGIWGTHVSIRGLSKQNIVTLIDGNRIETATNIAAGLSLVDVMDIERIEVIKGSASSLYGSGAVGGVVNIISKRGGYSNSLKLGSTLTSGYSTVNKGAKGRLALNVSDKIWFAKISGSMRGADDVETPDGVLENSRFRDNNISGSFGIKPIDNHELLVDYQRFYAKDVGIPGGAAFPKTAVARYPYEKREMISAEYKVKNLISILPNLSVKFFNQKIERRVELKPNPNVTVKPNGDHTTNGLQLQTNWVIGKSHYLVAGVDYWQRELSTWRTKEIKPSKTLISETPVPDSKYKSLGFYLQDEFNPIENLKVTIGGRIDKINITNDASYNVDYMIVNGNRNDNPPHKKLLWKADDADDFSASANLSLLYKISSEFDITFNVANSFRSPTLEERYQFIELGGATYLGDPNLDPERGTFIDLGFRVWKEKFSFSGNVFVNYLNNMVIDEYQNDSLYIKNNVGKARLYGFDMSVDYNVYKKIKIYSSLAYVKGEDTENNVDLPQIPALNGSAGVSSSFFEMFNADLRIYFTSDQNNVASGEGETPGYATFNFYLNSFPINIGGINNTFMFAVENIFDRAYRNHLTTNRGIINLEPGRNLVFQWQVQI